MAVLNKMSSIEQQKFLDIMNDPIKWAQSVLRSFNPRTKKVEPWVARWYQVEMMRDQSTRKVYRCGRRIGRVLPIINSVN